MVTVPLTEGARKVFSLTSRLFRRLARPVASRGAPSAFTLSGMLTKRDTVEMLTPAYDVTLQIIDSALPGMLFLMKEVS